MTTKSASLPASRPGAPALLCDPEGHVLEPGDLEVSELALEPPEAELLQRAARRSGRVLEREQLGLFGFGVAARIILPLGTGAPGATAQGAALLAAVGRGGSAIALGALGFDPEVPGALVLPRLTVLRREQASTALITGPRAHAREQLDALLADAANEPGAPDLPDRFELVSTKTHAQFRALVADAVAAVVSGELDKVVLAREILVTANRDFQQADLIGRLRALHPSCLSFAIDGFIGASPELLCRRDGTAVFSEPLAGTIARSGDPEADRRLADALFASQKERREHALVVDAITAEFARHQIVCEAPARPKLLELRNVAHLATPISGSLANLADAPSALELAAALHPTPAVGGFPKAAALAYLAKNEGLERARYAGPVGYLDAHGDGEFWIGIRSAELDHNRARLMAGVGIVEGSEPAAELAETQLKLQALLAVAVRP